MNQVKRYIISLAVFSVITILAPLNAQTPKSIDFTQQIKTLEGKPILSGDGKTPMTLSEVCVNALEVGGQDDAKLTGVEKMRNYELAKKIYNNKSVSLSADDIAKIKDRVAHYYATLVVGPVFEILDPITASQ